jgi:hypothetical protein
MPGFTPPAAIPARAQEFRCAAYAAARDAVDLTVFDDRYAAAKVPAAWRQQDLWRVEQVELCEVVVQHFAVSRARYCLRGSRLLGEGR